MWHPCALTVICNNQVIAPSSPTFGLLSNFLQLSLRTLSSHCLIREQVLFCKNRYRWHLLTLLSPENWWGGTIGIHGAQVNETSGYVRRICNVAVTRSPIVGHHWSGTLIAVTMYLEIETYPSTNQIRSNFRALAGYFGIPQSPLNSDPPEKLKWHTGER